MTAAEYVGIVAALLPPSEELQALTTAGLDDAVAANPAGIDAPITNYKQAFAVVRAG